MKLKNCTYGKLIVSNGTVPRIGMIIGVTNNYQAGDFGQRNDHRNAVPLVQWQDGTTCGVHPSNIELLK